MLQLSKPNLKWIDRYLESQINLPYSYPEVGATRHTAPQGYPVNYKRGELGTGPECFRRGVEALRSWKMYDLSWTELWWPMTPIEEGKVVGIVAHHFGLWSINPCRIIYTMEEQGDLWRSGFAFGTLPGHSERGEERFLIEWDRNTDKVYYEQFAFAQFHAYPVIALICHPFMRYIHRRFAADAFRAIKKASR